MSTYPTTGTVGGSSISAVQSTGKAPYVIDRTFDLTGQTLLTGTDVVNLMVFPANHMVLAARLKTTTVGTVGSGTATLKLRVATTDVGTACDLLTTAVNTSTTIAPVTGGTSATTVNVVAAIQTGTLTLNPIIHVRMVCMDMS